MGTLYKLDFANGKSYIGITTKSAETRFAQHRKSSVKGSRLAVHCAWRKHGEPALTTLAVLEDADLAAAEIRAIKVFNTLLPNGYNTLEGGQMSPLLNKSVAAKVSASMVGNKSSVGRSLSDEHKAKIGASSRGRKTMLGKTHSEEHKLRLSAALKRHHQLRKESSL